MVIDNGWLKCEIHILFFIVWQVGQSLGGQVGVVGWAASWTFSTHNPL